MGQKIMQIGVCFAIFGFCLYSYLDEQNTLAQLKMKIPQKEKEIQNLTEEKRRLLYKIDQFESPSNLIELAHRPEFRHLKHPPLQEVLTVPEAFATTVP
jgi:hypothetical protein